ncbi:MAG: prepilin-type N-terminal cleavage/methylation domain-containing protein [Cyanobacteria bacterium P01_F01_bin.150]
MELLLKKLCTQPHKTITKQSSKGFTLIELLVVVLIAGGIISGLMFMVVELLTADQKEASKNQTQQEMQMAMDYISAELREAVYVYDANCLGSTANGSAGDADYCPGLYNHLPTGLTDGDTTPILAFWKQEQLPTTVREACGGTGTLVDDTPCIAGHAYSLVVYSTDTANNTTWDGKSRITRYALDKYKVSGATYSETPGYVDPGAYGNEFRSWPYYQGIGDITQVNKQTGTLDEGTDDVLVDFVDSEALNPAPTCQTGYNLSTNGTITGFYGCVSDGDATDNNRDIILSLRGNAYGRPAISGEKSYLPIIETHVLSRPVLNKSPN